MLKGDRVTLRGIRRDDLPRLCEFNNDIEVEVAGGGDPPMPQSLERLQAEWDKQASEGGRLVKVPRRPHPTDLHPLGEGEV